jgi:hypothetical protein
MAQHEVFIRDLVFSPGPVSEFGEYIFVRKKNEGRKEGKSEKIEGGLE